MQFIMERKSAVLICSKVQSHYHAIKDLPCVNLPSYALPYHGLMSRIHMIGTSICLMRRFQAMEMNYGQLVWLFVLRGPGDPYPWFWVPLFPIHWELPRMAQLKEEFTRRWDHWSIVNPRHRMMVVPCVEKENSGGFFLSLAISHVAHV